MLRDFLTFVMGFLKGEEKGITNLTSQIRILLKFQMTMLQITSRHSSKFFFNIENNIEEESITCGMMYFTLTFLFKF